ncbi:hypothetical protein [Dapis sp. BLCC M172]|uniref:hypothetical protein n=1 Tax=Dapis sp. BLCC M172 TaxID=2975281 RepID=UPI003CE811F9
MSKYIVSIILISSVLTGLNMIPAITSNLTAQEQFYQQRSWKLIAQADQEDPKDDEDITPGKGRDDR